MRRLVAAIGLFLALALPPNAQPAASIALAQPNRPQPQPVVLDPATTALLVLDLNARCEEADQPCNRLVPMINRALPRFRDANVLTVYTVSLDALGTPQGEVWSGFRPLGDNEVVIYPDGSDKFRGGELDELLWERGVRTVIVTGASANDAVLYTASSAPRYYGYDVIIPMDGTVAANDYEYDYTMHQFTVISSVANKFRFTTLDQISFTR